MNYLSVIAMLPMLILIIYAVGDDAFATWEREPFWITILIGLFRVGLFLGLVLIIYLFIWGATNL